MSTRPWAHTRDEREHRRLTGLVDEGTKLLAEQRRQLDDARRRLGEIAALARETAAGRRVLASALDEIGRLADGGK